MPTNIENKFTNIDGVVHTCPNYKIPNSKAALDRNE